MISTMLEGMCFLICFGIYFVVGTIVELSIVLIICGIILMCILCASLLLCSCCWIIILAIGSAICGLFGLFLASLSWVILIIRDLGTCFCPFLIIIIIIISIVIFIFNLCLCCISIICPLYLPCSILSIIISLSVISPVCCFFFPVYFTFYLILTFLLGIIVVCLFSSWLGILPFLTMVSIVPIFWGICLTIIVSCYGSCIINIIIYSLTSYFFVFIVFILFIFLIPIIITIIIRCICLWIFPFIITFPLIFLFIPLDPCRIFLISNLDRMYKL